VRKRLLACAGAAAVAATLAACSSSPAAAPASTTPPATHAASPGTTSPASVAATSSASVAATSSCATLAVKWYLQDQPVGQAGGSAEIAEFRTDWAQVLEGGAIQPTLSAQHAAAHGFEALAQETLYESTPAAQTSGQATVASQAPPPACVDQTKAWEGAMADFEHAGADEWLYPASGPCLTNSGPCTVNPQAVTEAMSGFNELDVVRIAVAAYTPAASTPVNYPSVTASPSS
jgi:hypothetical protein